MIESLEETIRKLDLRREDLKMEVNKQIDDLYFEIMEKNQIGNTKSVRSISNGE